MQKMVTDTSKHRQTQTGWIINSSEVTMVRQLSLSKWFHMSESVHCTDNQKLLWWQKLHPRVTVFSSIHFNSYSLPPKFIVNRMVHVGLRDFRLYSLFYPLHFATFNGLWWHNSQVCVSHVSPASLLVQLYCGYRANFCLWSRLRFFCLYSSLTPNYTIKPQHSQLISKNSVS